MREKEKHIEKERKMGTLRTKKREREREEMPVHLSVIIICVNDNHVCDYK